MQSCARSIAAATVGRLRVQAGGAVAPQPRCASSRAAAPARSPGAASRAGTGLGHGRQGLARPAVPGRQALGLPQTARRGRDHPIAPRIATLAEVAKQPHRGGAPRIPALEQRRLLGVEAHGPRGRCDVCAPQRWRSGDRAAPCADSARPARHGRGRPALAGQGPALRMQRLAVGLALHGARRRRRGGSWGGTGTAIAPAGSGHGLLAHQRHCPPRGPGSACGTPGPGPPADSAADASGRPPGSLRVPLAARPRHRRSRAPARSPCHPGCSRSHGATGAAGRSGRRATGWRRSRSTQQGALRLAFAQGEISHAKDGGRGARRGRLPAEQAQQCVPAHPQVPRGAEVHPSRPPERHAQGHKALGQPQRAPRPGGRDGGQPFGEDGRRQWRCAAKPLADPQLEAHTGLRPGQISQGAIK